MYGDGAGGGNQCGVDHRQRYNATEILFNPSLIPEEEGVDRYTEGIA